MQSTDEQLKRLRNERKELKTDAIKFHKERRKRELAYELHSDIKELLKDNIPLEDINEVKSRFTKTVVMTYPLPTYLGKYDTKIDAHLYFTETILALTPQKIGAWLSKGLIYRINHLPKEIIIRLMSLN